MRHIAEQFQLPFQEGCNTMNIEIKDIQFAIVNIVSASIGDCLTKYHYLIYTRGNPDETQYDNVCSRTSSMWRQEIISRLPSHNAGCFLGKFRHADGGVFIANAWTIVDSGD
jgi:hypothetical protein